MIDVQAPSRRFEGAIKLSKSMDEFGFFEAGAKLSLVVPPDMKPSYADYFGEKMMCGQVRLFPEMHHTFPCAPMFTLRRHIHVCLGYYREPRLPWLLFDDDDEFREGSLEYYKQVVEFLDREPPEGRSGWFVGTAGHFGAVHSWDKFHLSPSNALMPKGHGLVFPSSYRMEDISDRRIDDLYGGLEEHTICAFAYKSGYVPVKRFKSPNKIKYRTAFQRKSSAIHDWDIWEQVTMPLIRSLSGDPQWTYPRDMKHKGLGVRNSPRTWSKEVQKLKTEGVL